MKKAILALTALLTVGALAGCTLTGGSVREVRLVTTEMKFTPDVVQVQPGEKIKFVIDNQGTVWHEFVSDQIEFHEVEVAPGESKSVEVKMPTKPGEYEFFCEAAGHHEAGMQGKIVVAAK